MDYGLFFTYLAACGAAAATGALFSPGDWYKAIRKPNWTPPDWLFPVAWTTLYLCMSLAAMRIAQSGDVRAPQALGFWTIQITLNALWSPVFFGLRRMRSALIVVALLGMLSWALGLITWTTFGRATTQGGFVDITVATIQSPAGVTASTNVIVAQVDTAAKAAGTVVSVSGNAAITAAVGQALAQPDLGNALSGGIAKARQALQDRPDADITIDVSALRDQIVARLQGTNPQLAAAIPAATDLTITVSAKDVPSEASTVASLLGIMKWTPLLLAIGALVLLGIGFLVTDDWTRTARHVGIGFLVLGILPILIRLIVPPLVAGAASGTQSDILEVAASATIANWWIALVVTLAIGAALLVAGVVWRQPTRSRSGPVVLGR
jgi:tryptophan-rich sensory protein